MPRQDLFRDRCVALPSGKFFLPPFAGPCRRCFDRSRGGRNKGRQAEITPGLTTQQTVSRRRESKVAETPRRVFRFERRKSGRGSWPRRSQLGRGGLWLAVDSSREGGRLRKRTASDFTGQVSLFGDGGGLAVRDPQATGSHQQV